MLQINTEHKYSTRLLVVAMKNIVEDSGKVTDIEFSKIFMTLGEINIVISHTKKLIVVQLFYDRRIKP